MRLNGLFFGFPARSHTVPSLSLVRGLVEQGAHIRYHSTAEFRPLIESAGAQYVAYPAACAPLADPIDLAGHVERVVDVTIQILPQLLREVRERTSFVVFDGSALWGAILARELAVTAIASITTFAFTRSMVQLLSRGQGGLDSPHLAALLARLGRSDVVDYVDAAVPSGDLKVVYTSRFFQPGGRFFDDTYLFVGPRLEVRPRDGVRVHPLGARPLAYVSFGTIFNKDKGQLNRISGILSDAGWQVVVSLGNPGRTTSGEWPPYVQAHPFVDQMAILSQARLVVTHGGMASVSEALAHGIPMIVVPQSVDQHVVARRAADLGAALVLDDASSTDQWSAALARIMAEPARFAAAAARIGDSFADVLPVAAAVERVLQRVNAE